jgi:hypothetical protein
MYLRKLISQYELPGTLQYPCTGKVVLLPRLIRFEEQHGGEHLERDIFYPDTVWFLTLWSNVLSPLLQLTY